MTIEPKTPRPSKAQERAAYETVTERSGGVCEGCGMAPATNIHHRKYRSRGGSNSVHNLIHLCGIGNAGGCHGIAHTGEGERRGWSTPSWAREETWPFLSLSGWVWVNDDGTFTKPFSESVATLLMNGGHE